MPDCTIPLLRHAFMLLGTIFDTLCQLFKRVKEFALFDGVKENDAWWRLYYEISIRSLPLRCCYLAF